MATTKYLTINDVSNGVIIAKAIGPDGIPISANLVITANNPIGAQVSKPIVETETPPFTNPARTKVKTLPEKLKKLTLFPFRQNQSIPPLVGETLKQRLNKIQNELATLPKNQRSKLSQTVLLLKYAKIRQLLENTPQPSNAEERLLLDNIKDTMGFGPPATRSGTPEDRLRRVKSRLQSFDTSLPTQTTTVVTQNSDGTTTTTTTTNSTQQTTSATTSAQESENITYSGDGGGNGGGGASSDTNVI